MSWRDVIAMKIQDTYDVLSMTPVEKLQTKTDLLAEVNMYYTETEGMTLDLDDKIYLDDLINKVFA